MKTLNGISNIILILSTLIFLITVIVSLCYGVIGFWVYTINFLCKKPTYLVLLFSLICFLISVSIMMFTQKKKLNNIKNQNK